MRLYRLPVAIILMLLVPVLSARSLFDQGQAQSSSLSGVIAGRIVDGTTGDAVTGAAVRLRFIPAAEMKELLAGRPGSVGAQTILGPVATDRDGLFRFEGLAPGRYYGSVTMDGFLIGTVGDLRNRPDTDMPVPAVDLSPGERLTGVVTHIWRTGSIGGVALDERSEPIVKGVVQVFRREYLGGRLVWAEGRTARTDDRGSFSVESIRPGIYVVALVGDSQGLRRTLFNGGSLTAEGATALSVRPGERHDGIVLAYRLLDGATKLVSLSGNVVGGQRATGTPTRPLQLRLVPDGSDESGGVFEGFATTTDTQGRFAFPRVPVGRYRLDTWLFPMPVSVTPPRPSDGTRAPWRPLEFPASPSESTWVGSMPLAIDRPTAGVAVVLRPGARITGRVLFAGGHVAPELLPRLPVIVQPASGRDVGPISAVRVESNGTFRTPGLPPGKYSLTVEPLRSNETQLHIWTVASIQVAGRERAGTSIEIGEADVVDVAVTMAHPAQISGTIRGPNRQLAPGSNAIVFPRDPVLRSDYTSVITQRRVQRVLADRHGLFLTRILPGEYLVAAVKEPPEFWMAPDYLETIAASATRVAVVSSQTSTVELTYK